MKNKLKNKIPFLLEMSYSFNILELEKTIILQKSKNKPKKFQSIISKNNIDRPFSFLYKTGDDLRKDLVILQAISLIIKVSIN